MKLMTKEIEKKLAKRPLGYDGEYGMDAEVIVKYFNPVGAGTWLITSGVKLKDGDWLLFGYCHILEWEWGEVLLSELESLRLPYGMRIERDLYSDGTVKEFL